jgi:hypothetical protein
VAEQIQASREDVLAAENQALKQQLGMLQTILVQRSVSAVDAWIDGLTYLAQMGGIGDQGALDKLGQVTKALEDARLARGGLAVVRGRH